MYPSIICFAVSPSVLTYLALQSPGLDAVEFTHVYSFGSWLLLHDSNIVVTFCSNESSQILMIQCIVNFATGSQVLSSIWYSCFLWFQMSPYSKSFFRVVIALLSPSPSPSPSLSPPLLLCFIQNGHAFCGHRSRVSNLSSVQSLPLLIFIICWCIQLDVIKINLFFCKFAERSLGLRVSWLQCWDSVFSSSWVC